MKRISTILVTIAALAALSAGCSQQGSGPLGPNDISTIDFPMENG